MPMFRRNILSLSSGLTFHRHLISRSRLNGADLEAPYALGDVKLKEYGKTAGLLASI
jgi:hypothetical protein